MMLHIVVVQFRHIYVFHKSRVSSNETVDSPQSDGNLNKENFAPASISNSTCEEKKNVSNDRPGKEHDYRSVK